ncbi:MAG: hypothetical protein ACHQJ4_03405 [Ignavibacteria bacterium]
MRKSRLFLYFAYFIPVFLIFTTSKIYSQLDLVDPSNKIYDFLDRMQTNKIISDYSSSMLPVSRKEVARLLMEIRDKSNKLSRTDKKFLDDYMVEYEYDISHTLNKAKNFLPGFKFSEIFHNKEQKYLYSHADSNSSVFIDGMGYIKYIGANGDSLGKPHLLLAQLGLRLRGTLFNTVGYYLRLSNGARLNGPADNPEAVRLGVMLDPLLASTKKFIGEGGQTYDSYEGYLRIATSTEWLGFTAGKTALKMGTGFIDQLVISDQNSAPFSFLKLDLKYKSVKYTFLHSSLVGQDSSGKQLSSKYLVFHRLEIGPYFNGFATFGFNEMSMYSNTPLNFAMLNPISFLTSAELNSELPGNTHYNSLIALDTKLYPVKKIALQVTLLIDDINFKTMGKKDATSSDNKLGYQGGVSWQDAFAIKNLNFIYEYTRLDPFVYSHREINNSYSNWNLPIGAALNPNSDEHAVKLSYDLSSRVNLAVTYKLQHSGMNITDSLGNIVVNVGSNILNGSNDFISYNQFLKGDRVDRNIITAELTLQPIRQYFLIFKFEHRSIKDKWENKTLNDNIFWGTFSIDY